MNSQISVRLVVLFYAFLYVSRREEGYEVTLIGLFAQDVGISFSHAGEVILSQSAQSSRSFLAHNFEPTEGLRHTENTERLS